MTTQKTLPRITSRRTFLRKSKVEYADHAINFVKGCKHGCRYCYAMTGEIQKHKTKDYEEWTQPKIASNINEVLAKEIPKLKKKIKFVFLSLMHDPFMKDGPEVINQSLRIIKNLNKNILRCVTLTKGIYPRILTDTTKFSDKNYYGISIISLDEEFRKKFEPGTASYIDRIKSLKRLHDHGLKTWVSIEPYPSPNLVQQDLSKLLESIKFVDIIIFGKNNHDKASRQYCNKHNKNFYKDCIKTVIKFCKNNGIKYHIKAKTAGKLNKRTARVFY